MKSEISNLKCIACCCGILFFINVSFGQALSHEEKLAAAQRVYHRIVQAIGDSRPPPRLRMKSSVQVAVFWPDKNEIDLDERAFDLCRQQADPDSALSVLLGHELAHFYGHHGWTREFGNSVPADLADQLRTLNEQDQLRCEMEADYFGGYYGYLAGFDTLGEFPKLIDAIYQRYQSMPGYPSQSEREAIAHQAEEKLDRLIPVFESGNLLLALRQYDSAAFCFDTIARDFPSREILNNAGVARAQEALELLRGDTELTKFVYPFELDADTRLRRDAVEARGLDDATRRKAYDLLIAAERDFDEAKAKDPQYAPAYVNLAGVYDLLGEEELAAAFADEASTIADESHDALSSDDAQIMAGIVAARQNKPKDAETILLSVHSDLARMNLEILHGGSPLAAAVAATQPGFDSIADTAGNDSKPMDDPPYDTIALSTLENDQADVSIRSKQTDSWMGYLIQMGDREIIAYRTVPAFKGKTGKGIAVGDKLEKVLAAYGEPTDVAAGRQENLYRFDGSGIIFRIGPDGIVRGWIVYSMH